MSGSCFADYAALPGVNWTCLKEMAKSPLHYRHRCEHPLEDTPRLAFGRAVHCAVLEPDRFPLEYVVFDGPRRAGKEWEAFAAVNGSRTILKLEEYETALAIRDAVRSHPVARKLLARGKAEQTLTWTDAATGLACKARPDFTTTQRRQSVLVDLKTTSDIETLAFGRVAARLGYHGQAAHYTAGAKAVTGRVHRFTIIAVEAEPPHDVAVFEVDDNVLWAGEELVNELLAKVAECTKARKWPGSCPGTGKLYLPEWAFPKDDASGPKAVGGY